MTAIKET